MPKEVLSDNEIEELLDKIKSSPGSQEKDPNCVFSESLLQQVKKVFSFTCNKIAELVISYTRCSCFFSVAACEELSFEEYRRSIALTSFNALYTWDSYPISINIDNSVCTALLFSNLLDALGTRFSDKSDSEKKAFETVKEQFELLLYSDFNLGQLKTIEQLYSKNIIFYFLKDLVTDMGRDTKAKSMFIPRLKKLESNSSWMNFIPDDERIILLTIESHIGEEVGMMNICIPNVFIKELKSMGFLKEE